MSYDVMREFIRQIKEAKFKKPVYALYPAGVPYAKALNMRRRLHAWGQLITVITEANMTEASLLPDGQYGIGYKGVKKKRIWIRKPKRNKATIKAIPATVKGEKIGVLFVDHNGRIIGIPNKPKFL